MLTEFRIRDDTAMVVTADDGEEFLDHGGIGHGQGLFEELIHVPMVMWVPGRGGPIRYPHPVSQVDLADTVLNLAGIKEHLGGGDLLTSTDWNRPIFAERRKRKRYPQVIPQGQWKFHRRYRLRIPLEGFDPCMTTQEMLDRYRRRTVCELYYPAHDPCEQNDLAADPACLGVRERLEAELDHGWKRVTSSLQDDHTEEVEMDPNVVERLGDLGDLELGVAHRHHEATAARQLG